MSIFINAEKSNAYLFKYTNMIATHTKLFFFSNSYIFSNFSSDKTDHKSGFRDGVKKSNAEKM